MARMLALVLSIIACAHHAARDPVTGLSGCPVAQPITMTFGDAQSVTPIDRVDRAALATVVIIGLAAANQALSMRATCTRPVTSVERAAAEGAEATAHHDADPNLASLVRTAKARADVRDCDAVRSIAARVSEHDPVYYRDTFVPAFTACALR
jgi:hypothetical protein